MARGKGKTDDDPIFHCPICHERATIHGWMDFSGAIRLLWKNSEEGKLTYLLDCNGCGMVIFLKIKKDVFNHE